MNLRLAGVCAAALVAAAPLGAPDAHAQACGADLQGVQRTESRRYVVAYRLEPEKPALSMHFSVVIAVCPKADAPEPEGLLVDARMPAHGHGMNYVATVSPLGSGRYRADGLMLHMPGRWEFRFDVTAGGLSERASHGVDLK